MYTYLDKEQDTPQIKPKLLNYAFYFSENVLNFGAFWVMVSWFQR
jgi:hypothetical protein